MLLAADGQRAVFDRHLLIPADFAGGDLFGGLMPRHRRLRATRILQAGGMRQPQLFALIQADRRRQHRQQRQKGGGGAQIALPQRLTTRG